MCSLNCMTWGPIEVISITNFEIKEVFGELLWAKKSVALCISLKNVGNIKKEAITIKVCINDMRITWGSNYRYQLQKVVIEWIPVVGHPGDRTLIRCREPVTIENFAIDTILIYCYWLNEMLVLYFWHVSNLILIFPGGKMYCEINEIPHIVCSMFTEHLTCVQNAIKLTYIKRSWKPFLPRSIFSIYHHFFPKTKLDFAKELLGAQGTPI